MDNEIIIWESTKSDFNGLLKIEREAFDEEEGPEIIELLSLFEGQVI